MARVKGDAARLPAATRRARAALPVALVSMPFVSVLRPSLQLGLLKALAVSHGFPVTNLNLNLDFARQIGLPLYETLSQHRGRMHGDWLFSVAAFGERAPDSEGRFLDEFGPELDRLLAPQVTTRDRLRALRDEEVPRYLDHLMETVPWERFRVVGFTSTFQQSVASFALASRLKRRFPHLVLLFGGANFEGEMGPELVRAIDCIDYAVSGEGDVAFPELLIALQEGRDPAAVPGVIARAGSAPPPRPPFRELDDLPTPDYDEYFERAEALGLLRAAPRRVIDIPFESSRGCWWGQKHHCTFCGLNGMGMAFRAKSQRRVREELAELARRYRSFQFEAVDNILDPGYLRDFFAQFTETDTHYRFFYEVKANLSREQIKSLAQGGVWRVQPGIESLNSHVLKLMNKGITAIQNVNTLRWAAYYGVGVGWNLIYGFPGETEEDYEQQLALLERIPHLEPPGGCGRIWMERFSPIFTDRHSFPARFVRAEASYAYVYPAHVDLDRMAYFFDYELENTMPEEVYDATRQRIDQWIAAWGADTRPTLTYRHADGFLQIEDSRDPQNAGTYTFRGPLAALYLACSDRPRAASGARQLLGLTTPVDDVEDALDEFCRLGLMMRDGALFLSLALPASRGRYREVS